LVGRGCGPFTLTPVLSAISLMLFATLSSCSRFALVSLIRAYFGTILREQLLDRMLRDILESTYPPKPVVGNWVAAAIAGVTPAASMLI